MHPIKCTLWYGVTSERVRGPYFFEDEEGVTVTVTAHRYQQMIENCLRPAIQDNPEMWFQQDGATAHTARQSVALLRGLFGERLISRFSGFNWPSRSPDLTTPDFFLWGYLKERVYVNNPRTIQELKNNIRHEIRELEQLF